MKIITSVAAALGSIMLSSCASKLTATQRDALSSVAVMATSVSSDAYSEPNGGDRAAAGMAAQSGVNSGTGALGGLVGSLVGESIAASQNGIFKGKSSQYFSAVKANTPSLSAPVTSKLKTDLKDDDFFGPRLRESSPNQITSEVTAYGLVRSGKRDDDNLLLTPRVAIKFALKDATGKKLAGNTYLGTGYNHPITKYASDPAEMRKGYEMAVRVAVGQFTSELALKSAE